jgi:hypothetical protein
MIKSEVLANNVRERKRVNAEHYGIPAKKLEIFERKKAALTSLPEKNLRGDRRRVEKKSDTHEAL